MRVVLFRHGPAASRDDERWPDDGLRPLTGQGEKRTAAAARGLARLEPAVSLVLTSPLARAHRTAEIAAGVFGIDAFETCDALAPGGSWRRVLETLATRKDEPAILLVGHEPDLGKLAGTLLFGAPTALPIKKAGGCAIVMDGEFQPGAGRLAWFLAPRMLRRWSAKKEKV
jgi:phosphohistidine phosphatase